MPQHAAIPTVYKGVQMRSRLEARWAFMFDVAGLNWQYEPIDLDGWIPDFVIDLGGERKVLVEIKPISPCEPHESSNVPQEVKDQIESALGAPPNSRLRGDAPYPGDEAWEAFFKQCPYDVLVLGNTPLAAELFSMTPADWFNRAGWHTPGRFVFGKDCDLMQSTMETVRGVERFGDMPTGQYWAKMFFRAWQADYPENKVKCLKSGDCKTTCRRKEQQNLWADNWENAWIDAGNAVQWKSPRRKK